MDILPSDLLSFGTEAKKLLKDLQSRNERMFLVTVILMMTAPTKKKLDGYLFQASSIASRRTAISAVSTIARKLD